MLNADAVAIATYRDGAVVTECAVDTDAARDNLRVEQNNARTRIAEMLSTSSQDVSVHHEVIAFCADHELVELASTLIEKLSSEFTCLANLHLELNSLFSELTFRGTQPLVDDPVVVPHASKVSKNASPFRLVSNAVQANETAPTEGDGGKGESGAAGRELARSACLTELIHTTDTQKALAVQSRLVHLGAERACHLLSTYTQKVARDALDAQRAADKFRNEYDSIRTDVKRLVATGSLTPARSTPEPQTSEGSPARVPSAETAVQRVNRLASEDSETESVSDDSEFESESDVERRARAEISLSQKLANSRNALEIAQRDALTKLHLASAYRSRTIERSSALLSRLELVYFGLPESSSPASEPDAKRTVAERRKTTEAQLKQVLKEFAVPVSETSAIEPLKRATSRRSTLLDGVASLFGTPSVRSAVRTLSDYHKRAAAKPSELDKSARSTN